MVVGAYEGGLRVGVVGGPWGLVVVVVLMPSANVKASGTGAVIEISLFVVGIWMWCLVMWVSR